MAVPGSDESVRFTERHRDESAERAALLADADRPADTLSLKANDRQVAKPQSTDQRNDERTLEEADTFLSTDEAFFRAIAELAGDYIWQGDVTGNVRWFSPRWYVLSGQNEAEALGGGWFDAIHPDDAARLIEAHRDATERGEPYDIEARLKVQAGAVHKWYLMRAQPVRDEFGTIVRWLGAGVGINDRGRVYEALEASERRFRTLVEGIPQLVWRSREGGAWTWSSRQWTELTGLSEEASRGLGWLEAWHPDDRANAMAAWQRAGSHTDFATEGRIFNVREQRYRYFRTRGRAVVAADGGTIEWLGTSTDVDDIMHLQNQQSLLVAELQHRTRNILGVVQSLVQRTVRGSTNLDDFARRADRRLKALARVQGLLSRRADNRRIAFDQLLRTEINAHITLDERGNGTQVTTSGPADVPLYSNAIQTMALAIHELITNALKYGALATPNGHLDISWRIIEDEEPRLFVEWRESGVTGLPANGDPPQGGGYGRELIERALPYQLRARTSYRFAADGVRCTIEVPVATDTNGG